MPDASARILVVDDEPSITEFVGYALRKEGFSVDVVDNGEDALSRAMKNDYDLFVLDIMLPGIDGYELCRRLRAHTSSPVLFLSARDSELDKVVGLEIGGDDYLSKPFGVRSRPPAPQPGRGFREGVERHHRRGHHLERGCAHRNRRRGRHRLDPARVRAARGADEKRGESRFPRGPAARCVGLGIPHGNENGRYAHQAVA